MKIKWNVKDPLHPTTIARLLSDLEGSSSFLDCIGDEEALSFINKLKRKYYKLYFQQIKKYQ